MLLAMVLGYMAMGGGTYCILHSLTPVDQVFYSFAHSLQPRKFGVLAWTTLPSSILAPALMRHTRLVCSVCIKESMLEGTHSVGFWKR
jgi:hypothetical protein